MGMVDYFKSLGDIAIRVHDDKIRTELQEMILNAQADALALQQQNYELLSENTKLKDQINELQHTDEIEKELLPTTEGALFYRKDKKLYCSTCWGAQRKLILLVHRSAGTRHGYCNNCKGNFPNAMGRFKTEANL